MADTKVSALDAIATLTADDLIYAVDGAATSKKITWANAEGSVDLDNITEGTTNKFFTATDDTKLGTIEESADVTDTTNVTAAGALMDSECASVANVKLVDQDVSSGAGPAFTSAALTTPALGTPSAGVLTSCTGLPAAAVVAGSLVSGMLSSDHGTASSAQIVNICYGTGTAPTASTTTEGSLFVKYTA